MKKQTYSRPYSCILPLESEIPFASGNAGHGTLVDFDDNSNYGGNAGSIEVEPFG